jgi:hypothetical protein
MILLNRMNRRTFVSLAALGSRRILAAGGTINDLAVGDTLGFEVIEDRLSGARAIRVEKVNKGGKRAGG